MKKPELWEKLSQAWWSRVDTASATAPPEEEQWADVIAAFKEHFLEEQLIVLPVAEISPMSDDALILRALEVAEAKARSRGK